ncbi:hypothetical protein L7F22_021389 [Adiantum nelumboides]|nr:hypothetical protein [Adiantum nelumboides]
MFEEAFRYALRPAFRLRKHTLQPVHIKNMLQDNEKIVGIEAPSETSGMIWCTSNNLRVSASYGIECSLFLKSTGIHAAQANFVVFGIDCGGHGKSEGIRCYIKRFSDIIDDCADYFKSVRDYKDKACFMLKESMSGVVALQFIRKNPLIGIMLYLLHPYVIVTCQSIYCNNMAFNEHYYLLSKLFIVFKQG